MTFTQPPPRSNLRWAGVDLDGTLAYPVSTPDNPTSEIGNPIADNVQKADELRLEGYKIHIHTSRPWTDREAIEAWLNYWGIPWDAIQCGKPLFVVYIDDRARHASDPSWLPGEGPHDD